MQQSISDSRPQATSMLAPSIVWTAQNTATKRRLLSFFDTVLCNKITLYGGATIGLITAAFAQKST